MKAKYQKYYDALKGVDLSSGVSTLSGAVSKSTTELAAIKSDSTAWNELGAQAFNDVTLPKIMDSISLLSENITGALTEVVTKCTELVSQLTELDSLEKELESLGSKWTYTEGGSKSQSEVNSHNNKIAELTRKIEEKESSIDGVIAAINGISIKEASSAIEASGTDTTTGTELVATPSDTSASGVLSYTVGKLAEPGKEVQVLGKRATLLDVTVDGKSIGQDGSITIKKGQTVHLKVKIPDEIQNVQTLKRTSADGQRGWSQTVSQKNYPQVNKKDPSTYANAREYDWYITGDQLTSGVTLSQTALFSIPGASLGSYKGMVRVKVKVVE